MRVGIVGHEAKKFTATTEAEARAHIRTLLKPGHVTHVVSGGCHLGGIDIWAVEEARLLGFKEDQILQHIPLTRAWSGPVGYMARNIKIALDSDVVYSLVVKTYPPDYDDMRFPICYHCKTKAHIKSGGCWTAKYAREKLGKRGIIIEI